MNQNVLPGPEPEPLRHSGLRALCGIAAFFRIAADPGHLVKELALPPDEASPNDLIRAAKSIGLKARVVEKSLGGPPRRRAGSGDPAA